MIAGRIFSAIEKSGEFSKYGKLLGVGKNNGIKAYECALGGGEKILTSIDKNGDLVKEVHIEKPSLEVILSGEKNARASVIIIVQTLHLNILKMEINLE